MAQYTMSLYVCLSKPSLCSTLKIYMNCALLYRLSGGQPYFLEQPEWRTTLFFVTAGVEDDPVFWTFLPDFAPILAQFWTNFGPILAHFWLNFGPILIQYQTVMNRVNR